MESEEPTPTGAADDSSDSTTQAPATDEPQSSTTEAAGPSFDGPPAPDFELALADGSVFRLSDEQKPVYMVFWAEW